MDIVPSSKVCRKCGVDKPLSEYHKSKRAKDGLQSKCKDCVSEYCVANRERLREYQQDWYQANRERQREYNRNYYVANREQVLERTQGYQQANRERKRERGREHYQVNRERIREQHREYGKANPHIWTTSKLRRRARKCSLPDYFTVEHMQHCLSHFNHTCAVCGSPFVDLFGEVNLHWDHWIALSAEGCPGTTPQNMVCLCNGCNQSKYAKLPDEWLKQKFGARKAKQIMTRVQAYFDSLADGVEDVSQKGGVQ